MIQFPISPLIFLISSTKTSFQKTTRPAIAFIFLRKLRKDIGSVGARIDILPQPLRAREIKARAGINTFWKRDGVVLKSIENF